MGLQEIRSGDSPKWHVPVLKDEILRIFEPHSGSRFIDATLGDGGHAEALLLASAPDGRLLGLDRDAAMLSRAKSRLQQFGDRFVGVHTNFVDIADTAKREGFDNADGILFDLGVASWHFDASGRGFSFQRDEPLDMRLSESLGGISAAEFINHVERAELERVLREYGEEPEAGKVADAILRRRPITTTKMLSQIIISAKRRKTRHHQATRSFQALRIAVNDELRAIERVLPESLRALRVGGVVAVLAYHSLEDRIVKRFMKQGENQGTLELLWKKPLTPDDAEIVSNPRARSAKLRAAILRTQIDY